MSDGFYLEQKILPTVGGSSTSFNPKIYDQTQSYKPGDVVLIRPLDAIVTIGAKDVHSQFQEWSKPGLWLCMRAAAPENNVTPPLVPVPTWPVPTPSNLPPLDCISYDPQNSLVFWIPIAFWPDTKFVISSFPTVNGKSADYVLAVPIVGISGTAVTVPNLTVLGNLPIAIAKKPRMRFAIGETIDGSQITYSNYVNNNMGRTASDGVNTPEKQVVCPRYQIGLGTGSKAGAMVGDPGQCIITAKVISTDTGDGSGIMFDANGNAIVWEEQSERQWATKFNQS